MTAADLGRKLISGWLLRGRRRPRGAPRWSLGIYKADRLGDFVLALGAIRLLVESASAGRSVLVISPYTAELAAREFPHTDLVVVDPWRGGAAAAGVERWRRRREDLFRSGVGELVCLRHHRWPAESVTCGGIPAAAAWGARNSPLIGAPAELATLPLDHRVDAFSAAEGESQELACHRAVVSAYLGRAVPRESIVPALEPGWVGGSGVVVSPFGSKAIRDIPRPLLAVVGRYLQARGWGIDLLCPPGEMARFAELARWLTAAGVDRVRVVPCLTTSALREALRRSRLVLSAETGSAHMAAALDAPLVAFLGGGHIGWFAPWARSGRQQWVSHDVPCRGCSWHCSQATPICLTEIAEDRVIDAIDVALAAG